MDATREVVTGPGVPTGIGPYSSAVRAGDLLFVSGQPGIDPETAQPVGSSFGEQARQTFRNLDAVLRAGGSRPELANTHGAVTATDRQNRRRGCPAGSPVPSDNRVRRAIVSGASRADANNVATMNAT
jgi:Endoribonuclease L-PSP